MQASWWQFRQWRFVLDMNRDGAWTPADISYWAHWLLFLPGDALIALIGPTELGHFLHLTPASFGSATSGLLSAALWVLGICCVRDFFLDCADPTYRQRRQEQREAEKRRRPWDGAHRVRKPQRLFWRIRARY